MSKGEEEGLIKEERGRVGVLPQDCVQLDILTKSPTFDSTDPFLFVFALPFIVGISGPITPLHCFNSSMLCHSLIPLSSLTRYPFLAFQRYAHPHRRPFKPTPTYLSSESASRSPPIPTRSDPCHPVRTTLPNRTGDRPDNLVPSLRTRQR